MYGCQTHSPHSAGSHDVQSVLQLNLLRMLKAAEGLTAEEATDLQVTLETAVQRMTVLKLNAAAFLHWVVTLLTSNKDKQGLAWPDRKSRFGNTGLLYQAV